MRPLWVAVALAEGCFGDHLAANMIVIGAAYQSGLIPIDATAIERAIGLNGVAVQMNIQAFRLGRRVVAELSPTTYERAVRLAVLPDMIRGYEDVKLRNVERFRAVVRELVGEVVSSV